MGPDQHAQLDGFGLIFPFPIRIAAVLVAGRFLLDEARQSWKFGSG